MYWRSKTGTSSTVGVIKILKYIANIIAEIFFFLYFLGQS